MMHYLMDCLGVILAAYLQFAVALKVHAVHINFIFNSINFIFYYKRLFNSINFIFYYKRLLMGRVGTQSQF